MGGKKYSFPKPPFLKPRSAVSAKTIDKLLILRYKYSVLYKLKLSLLNFNIRFPNVETRGTKDAREQNQSTRNCFHD